MTRGQSSGTAGRVSLTKAQKEYEQWLADVKVRINTAQQHATFGVNTELISLYWSLGHEILERRAQFGWGRKIIERLSHDLRVAFPHIKGFSTTNLDYMRMFAREWPFEAISQQAVGELP